MAEYTLINTPQFQSTYGSVENPDKLKAFQGGQLPDNVVKQPMLDQSTQQAAAYGGQAGGISGALIAGGTSSLLNNGAAAGGPYAIAGGLLLSQIEAAQKAKAEKEQQRVANENARMDATRNAYINMANQTYRV